MDQVLSLARKEWAIVVEALIDGKQGLLLQNGNLREVHQEFRVDHPQFLLYPTYEGQRADHVVPAWRERFARVQERRPGPGEVILKGYCTVEAVWEVRETARRRAVEERTIWSAAHLQDLFPEGAPLCALLVRAFRLPQAREIAELQRYGGSRNWVQLLDEISVEGARPVVTDEAFRRQANELHQLLG